ncbi:AAI domain-containing protein [Heracleum sosnowskyi]|uniref:Non-specific lipid-transfer protein n=1 Tax=Heracleum sosnowskyi TaxID=360622 RepID=A0AAD8IPB7_9APIA|nr:AAI domain-containing protein [Heracleum sosnowskyi]
MAKFSRIAYFMVVFGIVVHLMVERGEALSCGDLSASVSQCSSYATGAVGNPSGGCCSAVKGVYALAKTSADRKVLCNCLKQSSSAVPNVQLSNVAAIPQKCGVPLSFSPDPNFNCNSIQ